MVKDGQVKMLWKNLALGRTLELSAVKSGMDPKTSRKWRDMKKLPSEITKQRDYRTRKNPFEEIWREVTAMLELNEKLEAKTIFEYLQRSYIERFQDGQLRTFQRQVKMWRALQGPSKEVFFSQKHYPGDLCESDYTHISQLGITINGLKFDHLIYHFVLTYSNWETGSVCFSESFESLSEGFQNAIWELGGVPKRHRTDSLSSAVNNLKTKDEFTNRYSGLLGHYAIKGEKTGVGKGNENGDVEQRHHRFKRALEQQLMLRGSHDFASRKEYDHFLKDLFQQLNSGRTKRFREELALIKPLPQRRLESCSHLKARVGLGSTINVLGRVYSVNSRLIGEQVNARVYHEHVEVWYGQKKVEQMPRLRGKESHCIDYRHIIDWLIRKPGAFEDYKYHEDLFPTIRFRIAYDLLKTRCPSRAVKSYLKLLYLAANESESAVDDCLRTLIDKSEVIQVDQVEELVKAKTSFRPATDVHVADVDLAKYDHLGQEGCLQ